ncbi:hypothetical protein [Microbulbifer variabilis]|uniref:PGAP1-like alpha/beta domain-containing protein n=1 Tax=Microbulbifer variabilis TaxID=266805 RepID=UPI00036ABA85|nr:hypothetical protein [Microbulbifer variabilis]
MTNNSHHPFHPIIYVRGFALTRSAIEDAVADPYMGFNTGSTKMRRAVDGGFKAYYFESPLLRLISEYNYEDVLENGEDLVVGECEDNPIPYRCVVTYRYYEEASKDFGDGKTPSIEHFAAGLGKLILLLREKVCSNKVNNVNKSNFKVHLVAHSMGGLICRSFLQNESLSTHNARKAVDKVFTYATPHSGIDIRIIRNIPGWLSFGDASNFNRRKMADYFNLDDTSDVSLVENFPPDRIFNLVGTNSDDYTVLGGGSSWAVGPASDGLVQIKNATTHGYDQNGKKVASPRAFVHRSHSGHYGIVNSEEGYQNLTRFLFGKLRVDGILDIDNLTLPEPLKEAHDRGKKIEAAYQFEVAVSIRRYQWQVTRRMVSENSEIFRKYNELFSKGNNSKRVPNRSMSPHLFSVFLDPEKSSDSDLEIDNEHSNSVCFAIDLKVMMPDYEVDHVLFMKRHYEGDFIFRKLIPIEAVPNANAPGGWRIMYSDRENTLSMNPKPLEATAIKDGDTVLGYSYSIPIKQGSRPGITGSLKLEVRPWI